VRIECGDRILILTRQLELEIKVIGVIAWQHFSSLIWVVDGYSSSLRRTKLKNILSA